MKTANYASSGLRGAARLLSILTILTVPVVCAPFARASGIQRQVVTGVMYRKVFQTIVGVTYTFTTRNLSPNSNTIIHVLGYPSGQFIAGNDDTVTVDPDSGAQVVQPYSTVSIVGSGAPVYLVVRGKPGTPDGSADFRIRGTLGGFIVVKDSTTRVNFSAGFAKTLPSLAAGTHITTVEEAIGTIDTMVMVFANNDPVTTLAFDDDDAVDKMSFIRLGTACSSNCQIVVGTPTPWIHLTLPTGIDLNVGLPPGPVTLIWDETIESHDTDGDGLSDEFEAIIGTNPNAGAGFDTDGDGIGDGYEVYGAVLAGSGRGGPQTGGGKDGNLLKFPKYGANPLAQDIFVEIDWVPACPASDPNCCTTTTCMAGTLNADAKRATVADLTSAFNSISGAARVHIDAGIPTAAGDTNVMFGDWGGANRLGDDQVNFSRPSGATNYSVTLPDETFSALGQDKDCFTGVVPARVASGSFHHQIMIDHNSEGTIGRYPILGTTLFESAACALVATGDGSIAHELGHNFNLRHGGFPSAADGELNCKMNYGSIMSYLNQTNNTTPFAPGYSIGRFVNFTINGTNLGEANGLLVNNSTGILDVFYPGNPAAGIPPGSMDRGFRDPAFPMGIDWNMDGRIDNTHAVRAPANWGNTTCAAPYMRGGWRLMIRANSQDNTTLSTAALPVMTVPEASAASPQIYGVGKTSASTGGQKQVLLVGSGDASACQQQGLGTCTFWTKREAVELNNFTPQSQLAVAGPLVAYRDVVGNLWYLRRGKSSTGWLGPNFLATGLTGDPAAIEENGRVKVYAVDSSGFLRRWELDEATGSWPVSGEADFWEDGRFVQSGFGIGLAHGWVKPIVQGVFGAIPNRDKAGGTGKPMPIEFARRTSTTFTTTTTVPPHAVVIGTGSWVTPPYSYTTTVHQDRWSRFAAPGPSAAFSKPGLVYAPFDTSVQDDGRFYMTWVPGGTGFQPTTAFIMFTEGNDQTAPGCPATGVVCGRRLRWMNNQATPFADPDNQTRDLRFGVGLSRFGASVAGVATDFLGSNYFPAADGIVNANFHDFEDNLLVRHNLPCSVHGQSCDDSP
jgi:hypothetical protein